MIPKPPTSITVCESPAERKCYKYINTIAMKYTCQLKCQVKFGYNRSSGGSVIKRKFIELELGNDDDYRNEGYREYFFEIGGGYWKDVYTLCSEKYRVDFLLQGDGFNLVIEIDGAEYHLDMGKESERDNYFLETIHYDILHIPAKFVFFNSQKVYSLIIDKLNSITGSDNYSLERLI